LAQESPILVNPEPRFLVAVTGASGAEYARRLIEVLGVRTDVILTKDARAVVEVETGLSAKEFAAGAGTLFAGDDLGAAPASGSHRFRALVIVPCSGTTLAKIAAGIADNLVTRAAAVALKERRPLILVPRETPVSPITLENLLKLSRLGVVILPASPGFYGAPKHIADLVDFIVARILDQLGVEHSLGARWTGPPE
jgi:4-hydroxy-3-polyprenylbenzoate decarboxylase